MPWVGLYIAAASAVCTLAIAADTVNNFRYKKLWFPCKYTSLNSASLTVLAVAMKLPMDLNTVMIKSKADVNAKFNSLFFITTTVINFMPSLGSMNDKELVANVMGLSILVITIMGNVGIQILELRHFLKPDIIILYIIIPSIIMVVSLVSLVCLAVAVPMMKRNLKWMYLEKHNAILNEQELPLCMDGKIKEMMKYWVMAKSFSPQFVMARSVVCTSSSIIFFFAFNTIVFLSTVIFRESSLNSPPESPYGIYTKWIINIQTIGMYFSLILGFLRWFTIVKFRCSTTISSSFKKEFKIEDYWIQTLKDWSNSFPGLQIRPNRCSKYFLYIKWCVLTAFIQMQIFTILVSKTIVFLSAIMIRPFLSCSSIVRTFICQTECTSSDGDNEAYQDLNGYVLLLEGEAKFPTSFVRSICDEADRLIQTGRRKQSLSFLNLLHKSVNFNRVGLFNGRLIPGLLSRDPPDCWSLQVVTLTSIATALPNISHHKRRQLMSGVMEGLSLANIVEGNSDTNPQLKNIREVARVTWVEVVLYSKWLQIDLRKAFVACKCSEEVLEELSCKSEEIVMEFKREVQDPNMENPLNLPGKVVAANSMHRICQTIKVLSFGVDENEETDEELFERLSITIADILAACLANLPRAITKMCQHDCIEKQERSVAEAFFILGRTEQVIEIVGQKQQRYNDLL